MLDISDPESIVLFRSEYDRESNAQTLRIHIRIDGDSPDGEYVIIIRDFSCDGASTDALREFAAAKIASEETSASSAPRYLRVAEDDGHEADRVSAISMIDEGFKCLSALAEKSRIRRVLEPPTVM